MDTLKIFWGLLQLIGVLGISAFAGAGLTVLALRTWLSERIKGSIKNEYDEKIETLKAQLKSQYDEKLETHKAQLKSQYDIEIEQLKSRLSIAAAQQQVRFSRLHEKRAEVIADVYTALNDLMAAVSEYTAIFEPAGIPPREERLKTAVEAINNFGRLYRNRKIFIPHPTALKLDEINNQIRTQFIQFQWGVDFAIRANAVGNTTEKWVKISEELEKLSKVALAELEDDFRELLGEDVQRPINPAATAAAASSSASSA
jgi:hypothetical protein